MLKTIEQKFAAVKEKLQERVPRGPDLHGHAAVLLALTDEPDPQVILTLRSQQLSSHSGEVSLPGGRWDETDSSLEFTALRETHEEIGLPSDQVRVLGPLWTRTTRWQVQVTPWLGIVPADAELTPNPGELDAIFRVPLAYFLDDPRIRTDRITIDQRRIYLPAYEYEGFEIWGFTAGVLTEFLVRVLDAPIGRRDDVPVRALS
ncbi:NUDIX hydrolase [Microbulbifer hydrolyticus]|uniref:8-oxo-dGTP pyrophosphatase MutT (NUDIX family) n=1 Tax=Microbulbifer hydrolyticus TaxID=48074 RepID=A0A6P1T9X6_9GAMM|nr:CoA pyrophosphatase [Microbulbifer hydrolyticus]MBB5213167.1 8-oxo-dGTP pyrophosphatase MutT (NUDIX family) [Microbulbifer hydrolyticus]QHQ38631.1 NUDIX domain-containing protein [Microbulbifer hydrolyticus]